MRSPLKSLFEDDIFISYSRRDAFDYAERLASTLKSEGFSCFIDQWESPRGKQLPEPIRSAIRRTKMLVLVGSEEAITSEFVRLELTEFLKTERPIVPIDVGRALEKAPWGEAPWSAIEGVSRSPESKESLGTGEPSPAVVRRIEESYTFTRRNNAVRRGFWTAALSLPVLILLNIFGFGFLWVQAGRVQAASAEITRLQNAAESARKEAETARTVAEGEKANAVRAGEEAKRQKEAAEAAAKDAAEAVTEAGRQRAAAALAAAESKKQSALAEKRALTAEMQSLARQSLAESDNRSAMQKALEAVDKSKKIEGTVLAPAEYALRQSVGRTGGIVMGEGGRVVHSVAYSPNRKWMAAGEYGGGKRYIALWNLSSGELDRGPSVQPKLFDAGQDDPADVSKGSTVAALEVANDLDLTGIAVSNDGRWVVVPNLNLGWVTSSGRKGRETRVWDLAEGGDGPHRVVRPRQLGVKAKLSGHGGAAFSPDGRWLVVSGVLWRMTDGGPADGKDLKGPWGDGLLNRVVGFGNDPDGRTHWLVTQVAARDAEVIGLWNLEAAEPTAAPEVLYRGARGDEVIISDVGGWLVVRGPGAGIRLWDLKAGLKEVRVLLPGRGTDAKAGSRPIVTDIAIGHDGRWLAAGTLGGGLLLWELRRPAPVAAELTDGDGREVDAARKVGITSVAFSRDGTRLAAGRVDSVVLVWELSADGRRFNRRVIFRSNSGPTVIGGFSHDNKWLLTYDSAFLHLWDASERGTTTAFIHLRSEMRTIPLLGNPWGENGRVGVEGFIPEIYFSEDGRWLITHSGSINEPSAPRLWPLRVDDLIKLALQQVQNN